MNGLWVHRRKMGIWELVGDGRVQMTITDRQVEALCERTHMDRRDVLQWVASRPTRAYAA